MTFWQRLIRQSAGLLPFVDLPPRADLKQIMRARWLWLWRMAAYAFVSIGSYAMAVQFLAMCLGVQQQHPPEQAIGALVGAYHDGGDGPVYSQRMVAYEYPTGPWTPVDLKQAVPPHQHPLVSVPPLPLALGLAALELLACAVGSLVMAIQSRSSCCRQHGMCLPCPASNEPNDDRRLNNHRDHQQYIVVTTSSKAQAVLLSPITALASASTALIFVSVAATAAPASPSPPDWVVSLVAIRVAVLIALGTISSLFARSRSNTSLQLTGPTPPARIMIAPTHMVLIGLGGMVALPHLCNLDSQQAIRGSALPILGVLSAAIPSSMPFLLGSHGSRFARALHSFVAAMIILNLMSTLPVVDGSAHPVQTSRASAFSVMFSSPLTPKFALITVLAHIISGSHSSQHLLLHTSHTVRDVAAVLIVSLFPNSALGSFSVPNTWTLAALVVAAAAMVYRTARQYCYDDHNSVASRIVTGREQEKEHDHDMTGAPVSVRLPRVADSSRLISSSSSSSSSGGGRPLNVFLLMLSALLLGLGMSSASNPDESTAVVLTMVQPVRHSPQGRTVSKAHHLSTSYNTTRVDTTITLVPDAALPAPADTGRKAARVFAVDASFNSFSGVENSFTFQARIPTLDKWPRRQWDRRSSSSSFYSSSSSSSPSSSSSLSLHTTVDGEKQNQQQSLRLDQLWFAAGGNPSSIARNLLAAATFANETGGMQYRVYWCREDDPIGMQPDQQQGGSDGDTGGYLVNAFRKVAKGAAAMTGLVIMEGEPQRPHRTMHRKWFKMLAHMYSTAPPSVHWFMVGDDDTIWFPHVLHPLLASLDLDPTRDSAYLGDISESNRQSNVFGRTMAFGGGGMAISRALASRVFAKLDWCLTELGDFYGDGLMRSCIERVTQTDGSGPAVHLTRVPVFNQVDLLEWGHKGREYFSARFSRAAPVTLHHTDHAPPLISGIANRAVGTFKLWHLARHMPVELLFRRFMVHLPKMPIKGSHHQLANEDGTSPKDMELMQTVVITYGFHVRVYHGLHQQLHVDHHVDFDSDIPTTPDFVGIEWLLEQGAPAPSGKVSGEHQHDSKWPERNSQYVDYWLAEVDEVKARMVYVDERTGKRLAVQVECPAATLSATTDSHHDASETASTQPSVWGLYSFCSL